MKKRVQDVIKKYSVILAGSMLYAVAFDWLFVPNNIVMGGATGIAQIVKHFFPILPVGMQVLVMNIPLFFIGIRLQGLNLLFSSVFAMATSSLFVDIISMFITFPVMADKFLASIFGGLLVGVALGLQLMVGATSGGTELAAKILKYRFRHIQIGKICLFIDLSIITLYAVALREMNDALYAAVAMAMCSISMDFVIYKKRQLEVACIISDKGLELLPVLINKNFGVTEIYGKGAYSREDKTILLCVFMPNEIGILKQEVYRIDSNAFVILNKAQDVFGGKFFKYRADDL